MGVFYAQIRLTTCFKNVRAWVFQLFMNGSGIGQNIAFIGSGVKYALETDNNDDVDGFHCAWMREIRNCLEKENW